MNDPDIQRFINSVNTNVQKINTSRVGQRKQGEDLTVDGYIAKHGGIESHADGKVYTTKTDYLDHLKVNNCHIKDY